MDVLYQQYSRGLRRFLMRRHVQYEDAADIVQEAYCVMLQALTRQAIQHPGAFLYQVAKRLMINDVKRRRTAGAAAAMGASSAVIAGEQPSAYRRLQAEHELVMVRAALAELPPRCRQVFVLNRFENRTYGEIAAQLGLSTSMVEKFISQALAHLRHAVGAAPPDEQR